MACDTTETFDAANFVAFRDNLGAPAGALPNDTDGGVIGPAQFATFAASFGATRLGASAVQAAAIPKPSTAIMLGLLSVGLLAHRWPASNAAAL